MDVCPPIMPAAAASEPATFRQKSKMLFKRNRIHLSQLNSALMPAWIGQTWQWKVIDYFLGCTSPLPQNESENVTLPPYLFLFHNSVDVALKDAGWEGNLCAYTLQLVLRRGVPFDTLWMRNFWLTGIFLSAEHDIVLTKDTALICLRLTAFLAWYLNDY